MKLALAQMTSTADRAANVEAARGFCLEAARGGADLVALPENAFHLRSEGERVLEPAPLAGPLIGEFRALARQQGIWLLLGSVPEPAPAAGGKVFNTSVLIDRAGQLAAIYRKIHLFDIAMPNGPVLRESDSVAGGEEVVVVETEFGAAGLSICYDLRFPELYRRQARLGARLLFAPSAFTAKTGEMHWHLLCRARAVENQCFVIAPAQWGRHSETRQSYGHSLVVDPWGKVVAEKADGTGLLWYEPDLSEIDRFRAALPALSGRKPWLGG